ncbi:MAG: 23S rRNA (uracil(1939)-C(5))-methyltransferase RlmD [Clostridia bacterium]|nr:23S rRNA (uracil(1939)-C(5))-methyltransferase RlmD [Clostridia bacterium]
MKKNDIFEIEITGITDEGDGVGRAEGMAVFVPYALVGETVRVTIVKVLKNYAVGKLFEVTTPSPSRIKAECPYFYKCGGCRFWHTDYETELEYKRQKVEDCLRRIGGFDVTVPKTLGAKETRGYRNKGQFPVSSDGIGIYAKHSHRVIDIDGCIIQDRTNPEVIGCVRDWMAEFDIPPYDEETGKGCIRHIYTRSGDSGKLVCIVTNCEKIPHAEELVKALRERVDGVSGVLQNLNNKKTNVVLGTRFRTLWGEDFVTDTLGECKFRISPLSFYQVNKAQTEVLYNQAADFAQLSDGEVVWDLYCGIGTIGQFMASRAKKIVGIEVVPQAIENAKENAKLNGIENAEYHCGTAEELAPKLKGEKPDVVILDPPRKGCDESLLKTVAKTETKRIVYVSCKPSTLARDLKLLATLGYELKSVQPVDLFPRTHHVECVALLTQI